MRKIILCVLACQHTGSEMHAFRSRIQQEIKEREGLHCQLDAIWNPPEVLDWVNWVRKSAVAVGGLVYRVGF